MKRKTIRAGAIGRVCPNTHNRTGVIEMTKRMPILLVALLAAGVFVLVVPSPKSWADDNEQPLGAAVVIIETTDNDIELQVFVDGSPSWKRVEIADPNERRIYNLRTQGRGRRQGMSELFFASNPSHYLEDEPDFDEPVEAFLRRFPAGTYEIEARLADGGELEGDGILTHVLPALPKIVAPVSNSEDDPPVVDLDNLVIEWEPVTTRFIGDGPVEIIEYQVILDQVDPLRTEPWVDGGTRRALINLPGSVTRLTVPPEFLLPDAAYEFEILAIEASGNSTISVGEFVTEQ